MVAGRRYPVVYAIAPLTSRHVKDDRYRLGPLMDVREQGLHNKHNAICIMLMANPDIFGKACAWDSLPK